MDATLRKRIFNGLSCGVNAGVESPSLPFTELSVKYFQEDIPRSFEDIDMQTASKLTRRNEVSPCSMVLSLLYAKRLKQRNQEYLQSMSSTNVFFISMMMASKYLYDEGVEEEVYNDDWADSLDQDVDEVNKMEMDFLKAMDWRLFVGQEEFEDAISAIERRLAMQEGIKRGWFTYSELSLLLNLDLQNILWGELGLDCTKFLAVLSTGYLMGFLSLLGSATVAMQVSVPVTTATLALLSACSTAVRSVPMVVPSLMVPQLLDSHIFYSTEESVQGLASMNLSAVGWLDPYDIESSNLSASDPDMGLKDARMNPIPAMNEAESESTDSSEGSSSRRETHGSKKKKQSSVLSLWLLELWTSLVAPRKHTADRNDSRPAKPAQRNTHIVGKGQECHQVPRICQHCCQHHRHKQTRLSPTEGSALPLEHLPSDSGLNDPHHFLAGFNFDSFTQERETRSVTSESQNTFLPLWLSAKYTHNGNEQEGNQQVFGDEQLFPQESLLYHSLGSGEAHEPPPYRAQLDRHVGDVHGRALTSGFASKMLQKILGPLTMSASLLGT